MGSADLVGFARVGDEHACPNDVIDRRSELLESRNRDLAATKHLPVGRRIDRFTRRRDRSSTCDLDAISDSHASREPVAFLVGRS